MFSPDGFWNGASYCYLNEGQTDMSFTKMKARVNLEAVRNWKPTFIRDYFISLFHDVKMAESVDKSLQLRFMTHNMISIIHFFKKPSLLQILIIIYKR